MMSVHTCMRIICIQQYICMYIYICIKVLTTTVCLLSRIIILFIIIASSIIPSLLASTSSYNNCVLYVHTYSCALICMEACARIATVTYTRAFVTCAHMLMMVNTMYCIKCVHVNSRNSMIARKIAAPYTMIIIRAIETTT